MGERYRKGRCECLEKHYTHIQTLMVGTGRLVVYMYCEKPYMYKTY